MMRAVTLVLMILAGGCAAFGHPPSSHAGSKVAAGDGTGLIAAFNDNGALKKKHPEAQLLERHGEVTIWQLGLTQNQLRELGAIGQYSPVFGAEQGQLRALPGGVVVQLEPNERGQAVLQQLDNQGHRARAAGLPDTYLVDTAPGLASLQLSRHLSGMAGVKSAEPNWWHARTSRR